MAPSALDSFLENADGVFCIGMMFIRISEILLFLYGRISLDI